jgi:hypothetical protein
MLAGKHLLTRILGERRISYIIGFEIWLDFILISC